MNNSNENSSKNQNNGAEDDGNPADIRGIHKYRFKWKNIVSIPKEIKFIYMTYNEEPEFFIREKIDELDKNVDAMRNILNKNILNKLIKESSKFKVIGARGRNVIVGEVSLKEFGIKNNVLILCSLSDWRKFSKAR
ncbi:MAG: hypothetical protein ACTSU2_07480 [Promethearchaeota archaeon]